MARLREAFRRWLSGPKIRPWGLAGPILVLIVCLPMLRPLRHPGEMSVDESARLATIRALVEDRTLAISGADLPRSALVRRNGRSYSDQPPVLSIILSGAYWIMVKLGTSLDHAPALSAYLLTLIGATLPVAWSAALIYRMGRLFELSRPMRAGLSIASVFGTGLLSYATVLNAHAPAATMLLAGVGALVHVALSKKPGRGGGWFVLAGFCSALAVTFDPAVVLIVIGLLAVMLAMRFSAGIRVGGLLLFFIGATPPIVCHTAASFLGSGRFIPASAVRDLRGRVTVPTPPLTMNELSEDDEELAHRSTWLVIGKYTNRFLAALFGEHGLFSHFPVLLFGVLGVGAVMRRHWPAWTKMAAMTSLAGATMIVGLYCFSHADWREAMFATRWFVCFAPLVLYWAGAWFRQAHSPVVYVLVGICLAFSTVVSILGATHPYPRAGFDRYTPAGALMQLTQNESRTSSDLPPQVARNIRD